MPKRTREHELEAQSRHELSGLFLKAGWTVENIRHDYGEDLFVRIFNEGKATHYTFFVQAKATDHIERCRRKKDDKNLYFSIDRDHLDSWVKFWEPVLLTLWDAKSNITYWVPVQDVLAPQSAATARPKKLPIRIPINNTMDTLALKEIAALTVDQFARLERERKGAELLVKLLEQEMDASIAYRPQSGILVIMYNHPTDVETKFYTFGIGMERLDQLGAELGMTGDEFMRREMRLMDAQIYSTGDLTIRDAAGNVIKTFDTMDDYKRYMRGLHELKRAGFKDAE